MKTVCGTFVLAIFVMLEAQLYVWIKYKNWFVTKDLFFQTVTSSGLHLHFLWKWKKIIYKYEGSYAALKN